MPRTTVENDRIAVRLRSEDKATIARAAALTNTDLTSFVVEHALSAARTVIEEAERIQLTGRDSLRVLDYLESPPAANDRLRAAARGLTK